MSGAPTDAKRRVKLYALNENRQWDDKGTGHVTSCYHEPLDGMSLLVRNESDGSLLLESRIHLDTVYQKQQGTLIVWTESDNYELALSFQEQDGCNEIWEKICLVQGRDPAYDHDQDEEQEEVRISLVDCELEKLDEITEQINAFSQTARKRDLLSNEYADNNYIGKLLDIFREADQRQDYPTLHKLYEIFRQLFVFDRPQLLDVMLADPFLIDIIGVLEYEPPPAKHHKHREFVRDGTTFKEVIPFGNQKLVDKIHQTYRVQYLQSSILPSPSILDDNAYASLTNILQFFKVEIVSMIQEDGEFLQDLFDRIISRETSLERKKELVLFLREYCIFSQTIHQKQRDGFFKTLASLRILSAVEVALSSDDQVIKSAAIDIFTYLVEYNPNMTREHVVQQSEGIIDTPVHGAHLLKLVIEHITTDQDPELGTATQLACIAKLILDPEMQDISVGKEAFIEFFYFTCMQSIVEPINNVTTPEVKELKASGNDRKTAHLLSIMLDLLTFLMEHHHKQLRSHIKSTDLLSRIVTLMKSRHTFLVLSAIRFCRRLIAKAKTEKVQFTRDKDKENENEHDIENEKVPNKPLVELIINEDMFSPIISVLKNNNGRYNLLDSAILEMFEFISNESIIPLACHVLTNFGPFLESIDYVDTFKHMRDRIGTLDDAMGIGETTLKLDLDDDEFDINDELEPQFKRQRME